MDVICYVSSTIICCYSLSSALREAFTPVIAPIWAIGDQSIDSLKVSLGNFMNIVRITTWISIVRVNRCSHANTEITTR